MCHQIETAKRVSHFTEKGTCSKARRSCGTDDLILMKKSERFVDGEVLMKIHVS